MMRFTIDHKKTSKSLSHEIVYNRRSRTQLDAMIPRNYYPRMDCSEGRNFILTYLTYYKNTKIFETFAERGLDINAPINDNGDTFLHLLVRQSSRYGDTIDALARISKIDLTKKNRQGQTALDVYIQQRYLETGYNHTYYFLKAELAAMQDKSAAERANYLSDRIPMLMRTLSDSHLLELIPSEVSYAHLNDGKTILHHLAANGRFAVLGKLAERKDFVLPDRSEPILLLAVKSSRVTIDLIKLLVKKGCKINDDVFKAAINTQRWPLIEFVLTDPKAVGGRSHDKDYFRRLFEWFITNKNVSLVKAAMAHPLFEKVANIDAPVLPNNATLLMHAVANNQLDDAKTLIGLGASITHRNAAGHTVIDIAKPLRDGNRMRAYLQERWDAMCRDGDYTRLDAKQISWKSGVLTYIFDFNAGQVVVRENETKSIASQSMADFGKSGRQPLLQAARMLEKLGGDSCGYAGSAEDVTVGRLEKPARKDLSV